MNTKNLSTALTIAIASTISAQTLAAPTDTSAVVAGIETSHPHRMPKLISLETAEIVESYGIGFSGGGNIHRDLARGQGLAGTAYIGLGEVVQLGYTMEEVQTTGADPERATSGHIKLALLKESSFLPMVSIGYSSTLNGQITSTADSAKHLSSTTYDLQRGVIFLGCSKTFDVSNWRIGAHPSLQYISDDLSGQNNRGPSRSALEPALALTWQQTPQVMYMAEAKWGSAIDLDNLTETSVSAKSRWETNLGVRFYLRNWLFMDAGIRHAEIPDQNRKTTGIHANFSGVIPLKSIATRMSNGSN